MDELLAMAAAGDTVWIDVRNDYGVVLDESKATFAPRECRTGYQLIPWLEDAERPFWMRKRRNT
jgi:hypothetical protein